MHEQDFANAVLENAGALIVVLDKEGQIRRFNRACEKLSGFTFSEIEGRFLWDTVLPSEDAETIRKNTFDALTNNPQMAPTQSTYSWVAKNGKQYLLDWVTTPMFDVDGQIEYIINISVDNTERHYIEDAFRKSEHQFHDLADQAPIMIGATDETGHITFLNKTWLEFRGKTLEEEEGWAWAAGLHPEDREKTISKMEACIAQLKPYSIEYRIEDRNGKYHWLLDTATPRLDSNGQPCGYIGTATNITERKKTEDNLRDASLLNTRIIEESPIGLAIYDHTGKCLKANQSIAQMIGATREQMLKQNYNDILSWKKCGLHTEVKKAVENNAICHFETPIETTFGKYLYLDLQIVPFNSHGQRHLLLMAADITERKQANEALQKSEERFRTLVENVPGVSYRCTCDEHWTMKFISSEIAKLSGYPVSDFINNHVRSYASIIHPDDEQLVENTVLEAVGKKETYTIEYRIIHADGEPRWVYEKGQGVFNTATDNLQWLDGVILDITERKHIEAELEHHRTHLEELIETRTAELEQEIFDHTQAEKALRNAMKSTEQANRAKSEFLSSMSHELRTPLNSILGFGQILNLNLEEPLSDGQKSCVDQILSGGQHLLELINEILDLARIEAGEVNLSLEAIQVTPLLDKCLNLVQTQAQDRGIQFIKEYASKEFTIVADYTRIQQVLLNLLSNAIKYNQANGTITINCWETSTGMLRISVTDTGQGIPANKHDEIFQPFNRLGVKAAEIEGTGIGLTVSRTLVKIMEGNIGFDSKAGVGSTFWVEFLLLAEQILDDETTAELYGTSHKPAFPDISGTLLYVEDNPSNMQLMKTLVENIRGLTMISADTAELGIEMARTQQPDVVIFDINLPGMSGIEALGELKKLKEIAHIPILALSASAGKKDIERGLEAGFQSYLTKPLQITELVDTLKDLLDARSDSIH